MSVDFKIIEKKNYTVVHFELKDKVTPNILKNMNPPGLRCSKGVVISGRGPIWLHCYLVHYYHPTSFIATYDPRVEGAIIVESHKKGYETGDVIKVDCDNL
ncbi:putative protein AF_1864 [Methanothermobacter wolfeii]|uniref:CRISPR-associated ring nuclease Crn3/Csx3 n=1 Tax=Methanothermobacter TaxID=145260 RepID=UPI00092DA5F0|nr:CRISPR-associated ring nuclease Crn3/Csx3 [Methanothermobacter sp. THM-1]QHN06803.1 CRISPR-associated protein Csx3 [Methanothermobacter sp. THM-1]SCM58146.1 putative protein AF_1864 [Methanothermobacter wolfeii]